jgi:hypothetical protein
MTLQELKYRVLLRLGVVAAGESVNADDGETVLLRYRALNALLLQRDLINWTSEEGVPDEYELPILDMVAAEAVGHFAHPDPQGVIAMGKFGLVPPSPAEIQLRQLASPSYMSRPVQTEYF